ncbi:hypothetical protein [Listeria rocourtiae]|uniref:hypothetical protein n=1 Tax=Listeria rocourtiae TaxID=647910 RepID=UPI003D2F7F4D
MYQKLKKFDKEHPVWSVLIAAIVGSVIGISMEYIVNGDFIYSGVYGALFFCTIWMFIASRKVKRDKR